MKWTKIYPKLRLAPKQGDKRTCTFFAWFPVSVIFDIEKETRWLETVTITQMYHEMWDANYWETIGFVDSQ